MTRRTLMTLLLAGTFGTLLASNMAYRFVHIFPTADPDTYFVALPLNNNYADLKSVFDDISAKCPSPPASVAIYDYDRSSCTWSGDFTCNTGLVKGIGIAVTMTDECNVWRVVGSNDNNFVYHFSHVDPNAYDVGLPYNSTATTLQELFDQIPHAASTTIIHPDQTSCTWSGVFTCNEPLTVGYSYRVSVDTDSTWKPPVYQ